MMNKTHAKLFAFRFGTLLLLIALSFLAVAQDGVSNESAARSRYLANRGEIPPSKEISVEDFVNYPRHDLGRPKAGEAVALDLRWERNALGPEREAVLQIGMSTALAHDRASLRPVNLAVVIDKSGSMADDSKLVRVKQALLTLVTQLRSTDDLAIVVFDSNAKVLIPSEPLTDKEAVKRAIRGIEPGSATNLSDGLMLGYREALKNFRKDATNRVLLLTDGIANRGITDPREIAARSASYNDKGIDLSTIGVGQDLNQELLKELAKSGRGLFHFVADSEDIQKVFVKELQSLIAPVAQDPNLEIDYGPGLRVEKVYGFEPKAEGRRLYIPLANMNSGMTEVVLVRFRASGEADSSGKPEVSARLSYFDMDRNSPATLKESISAPIGEDLNRAVVADDSVVKNVTIAELAQSIKDMAGDCEAAHPRAGLQKLDAAIEETQRTYPHLEDEDIDRTLKIALKYRDLLRQQNGTQESDQDVPAPTRRVVDVNDDNLVFNGDFSLGNVGFTSDLSYLSPTDNSLWSGGYTVARSFNEPQLHHMVRPEAFSAPEHPKGGEEVFFANAGGSDELAVYSTQVRCKPNTKYRIRFYSISLSGGPEWTPTYEIRINGARSEPQPAGTGEYKEISMVWTSGNRTRANLKIMRMPIPHGGGLIGIANISMTPVN